MALHRVQIPSPNHSGNRPSSRLLVVHTSEGATTFRNLGNFLANPSSQVSYQVGFDDTSATEIGEYVAPPLTAWAAMNANSWGEHGCLCTPSGASQGWSRTEWLAHDTMLRACGAWIGEQAERHHVAVQKIGADEIRAGRSGVCGHGDCSAAGAGGSHTDPGPNFPWDVVIAYALHGKPFPEPEVEDEKMYVYFQWNNGMYLSDMVHYRWLDGEDLKQTPAIFDKCTGKVPITWQGGPDYPRRFGVPANEETARNAGVPFP